MNPRPTGPVLIVDDSADDFLAACRGLRKTGLEAEIVHKRCGEQALDYLAGITGTGTNRTLALPRLILLDLNMPGMSGLELLQILKTDGRWVSIPVVILTTSDAPQDIRSAYTLGANSYICKPVDLEGLMQSLQTLKTYWFDTAHPPADPLEA